MTFTAAGARPAVRGPSRQPAEGWSSGGRSHVQHPMGEWAPPGTALWASSGACSWAPPSFQDQRQRYSCLSPAPQRGLCHVVCRRERPRGQLGRVGREHGPGQRSPAVPGPPSRTGSRLSASAFQRPQAGGKGPAQAGRSGRGARWAGRAVGGVRWAGLRRAGRFPRCVLAVNTFSPNPLLGDPLPSPRPSGQPWARTSTSESAGEGHGLRDVTRPPSRPDARTRARIRGPGGTSHAPLPAAGPPADTPSLRCSAWFRHAWAGFVSAAGARGPSLSS